MVSKQDGVEVDSNNVVQLETSCMKIRYIDWIKHETSIFLLGLVVENEKGETALKVYNLEIGLGLNEETVEWRLEKLNMLHFLSK